MCDFWLRTHAVLVLLPGLQRSGTDCASAAYHPMLSKLRPVRYCILRSGMLLRQEKFERRVRLLVERNSTDSIS
eukprot:244087-Rhodomonas_salina.1